jgi:hypothetical protein
MSRKAWWAILPGGVLFSVGVMILLIGAYGPSESTAMLATGLMFLGWAATFGLVWLRREPHPNDWARFPAAALALLAVIVFLNAAGLNITWPVALIVAGVIVLYLGLRRTTPAVKP